tara:strand:- start:114 stop:1292 length:1179 start_codon:yes stop_codon:yes gene_type:complete
MIFLNLGYQPLANRYKSLNSKKKKEIKYKLLVNFDPRTKLVSIKRKFSSKIMFNDSYPYRSSMSKTMVNNFKELALKIKRKFIYKKVLEIGCNDGAFLKHFNDIALGVEPCGNIAKLAEKKKIKVISDYWTKKLANKIKSEYGLFDIIYSANTLTHIKNLNDVFKSINLVLNKNGVLIIEDPSLLECIKKNTYDQFYNEHIYVFSLISLSKILKKFNLRIFKLENLDVHGGSNRYYICKNNSKIRTHQSIKNGLKKELKFSLDKQTTYKKFGLRVKKSKRLLLDIFEKLRLKKNKVIGYGASAKAVTILNYCGITNKHIEYFLDTTPEKQNKILPGTNILIKKYTSKSLSNINYAFLGAWNFKNEIFKKENKYLKKGCKFITHAPMPKIVGK